MNSDSLLCYEELLRKLNEPNDSKYLLLGNGFSIGCDTKYSYDDLFAHADKNGLTPTLKKVFNYFGTTNFEGIVKSLDDMAAVCPLFGLTDQGVTDLKAGADAVRSALINAVAETHLDRPSDIARERKISCATFLRPYIDVFSTNYDLLLYWVHMAGLDEGILGFEDGFRPSSIDRDPNYVVFSGSISGGIFYLHGALHLYSHQGEIRKACWNRSNTPLKDNVLQELKHGRFPMFVAEGEGWRKLEQIQRNPYMFYCLNELKRRRGSLVVYGSSLGGSDEHILNALADGMFHTIAIGVFGDHKSASAERADVIAMRLRERRSRHRFAQPLRVLFYDSRTAQVWGNAASALGKIDPAAIFPDVARSIQQTA